LQEYIVETFKIQSNMYVIQSIGVWVSFKCHDYLI